MLNSRCCLKKAFHITVDPIAERSEIYFLIERATTDQLTYDVNNISRTTLILSIRVYLACSWSVN